MSFVTRPEHDILPLFGGRIFSQGTAKKGSNYYCKTKEDNGFICLNFKTARLFDGMVLGLLWDHRSDYFEKN